MILLCDTYIDVQKQSVGGDRKVLRKSLKTVSDEIHFAVDRYSFPLSPVPQANPSFHQVSHLPPLKQNNFQSSPVLYTCQQ